MVRADIMKSVEKLYKASNLYRTGGTALAVCAGMEVCLAAYSFYKAKKAENDQELRDWMITASIGTIQGLGLMILSGVMDTQSFVLGSMAATTSGQVAIMDAINAIKV